MRNWLFYGVIVIGVMSIISCGNVRQLQYLQGSFDTTKLSKIQFTEPTIQKGDLLSIVVYSDNPAATAIYNLGTSPSLSSTSASSGTPSAGVGYLVSTEGNISMYGLGDVHAEGLTKKQLSDFLVQQYTQKNLLQNPFVDVRFLNYKITLIGDVSRPGVYSVPAEKINVFEAIGLAGDLTTFGRRDNVLVIRETNGTRQFGRLDLRNPDIFLSPYYYLQQNDVVVVDLNKNKAATNDQTLRTITITTSILSTIAIILNIFR